MNLSLHLDRVRGVRAWKGNHEPLSEVVSRVPELASLGAFRQLVRWDCWTGGRSQPTPAMCCLFHAGCQHKSV